jgi:hypothetical protein
MIWTTSRFEMLSRDRLGPKLALTKPAFTKLALTKLSAEQN